MNVASLENCKELYELSGWVDTHHCYHDDGGIYHNYDEIHPRLLCPAYDLGYLLWKLPPRVEWKGRYLNLELAIDSFGEEPNLDFIWVAQYGSEPAADLSAYDESYTDEPANPANAACKLAIELIKQGVIDPKAQDNDPRKS